MDEGLTHCIVESTSHGLAQHRLAAIDFDLAIVTNITHEHLDYHGSYERYFAAKARLFKYIAEDSWPVIGNNIFKNEFVATAILNRDDASYRQLAALPYPRSYSYGMQNPADVSATDISFSAQETKFRMRGGEAAKPLIPGSLPISSTLVGMFNIQNMLAAATAARGAKGAKVVGVHLPVEWPRLP